MLTWQLRAKRDRLAASDRRRWLSLCGRYCIDGMKTRLGPPPRRERFYALRVSDDRTEIISDHRTREAAMRACERDLEAKENDAKPAAKRRARRSRSA